MSPFAIFNFIWRQNTAHGDFFGDNILFIKNYFVLLSINSAGKKHRLLERASYFCSLQQKKICPTSRYFVQNVGNE
jgi:hypothetical protein